MRGHGLIIFAAFVSQCIGQLNSVNDLMTLQALDIDIPETAFHNILGGGGRGMNSVLRVQHNIGFGSTRQNLQGSLGSFGGARQIHQGTQGSLRGFGAGNLGQSQQHLLENSINIAQHQPINNANTGNIGINSLSQQPALNSVGNSGTHSLLQHNLNSAGDIGQNTFSSQSSLNTVGQGFGNQQRSLVGLSNTGRQLGAISSQNRLSGSTFGGLGASQGNNALLGGNRNFGGLQMQGQGFGQGRSLRQGGLVGNTRGALGGNTRGSLGVGQRRFVRG